MLSEVTAAPRLSREERKTETRRRLLEAAARVFARRGYHAATVDDVAAEAGFTTGALYAHFGSKRDLFMAILSEHITLRMADYASAIAGAATPEARVRAAADNWVAFIDGRPEFLPLAMEFRALASRDPELQPQLMAGFGAIRAGIAALVRAGAAQAGVDVSDARAGELAVIINALGIGFAMERSSNPEDVPAHLFGDAVVALLRAEAPLAAAFESTHRRNT